MTAPGNEVLFSTGYSTFRVGLGGGQPQLVAGPTQNGSFASIGGNRMVYVQTTEMPTSSTPREAFPAA